MTEFRYGSPRLLHAAALRVAGAMVDGRYDSPVEATFALALSGLGMPVRKGAEHPGHVDDEAAYAQVQFGILRVDFLIGRVVVELDGHEWHERTPEQVERDHKRDRQLIACGYTVLRFSGREVIRDPRACAEEALTISRALAGGITTLAPCRRDRVQPGDRQAPAPDRKA